MANDDFTRTGFDLSPWQNSEAPLSIFQAAWLWAGIPPTLPATPENKVRYPVQLASALGWFGRLEKEAKARESGKLPIIGDPPTKDVLISRAVAGNQYLGAPSRPAEYRTVPADDWRDALVARADVRAYAESIGQRPAFLFPDVAAAKPAGGRVAGDQGVADSEASELRGVWARGMRRVAWDAAKAIVDRGDKLTWRSLEKEITLSDAVEIKEGEFHLKIPSFNLDDRETHAKPKTIAGWVTDLKKLLKQ